MIHVQGKLPRELAVAVSGGPDSMAVLDFLRRNHDVTAYFCDHGTNDSMEGFNCLGQYATKHSLPLLQADIAQFRPKFDSESQEEYWREFRYDAFCLRKPNTTIVMAHHLDDCVETWIWNMLNGKEGIIPYRNRNVIRPFRLNRKRELVTWCNMNAVPYYEDKSNLDISKTRNYIRHNMMPHVLRVNPGIYKVIKKKVVEDVPDPK